eukprot:gene5542-7661_t
MVHILFSSFRFYSNKSILYSVVGALKNVNYFHLNVRSNYQLFRLLSIKKKIIKPEDWKLKQLSKKQNKKQPQTIENSTDYEEQQHNGLVIERLGDRLLVEIENANDGNNTLIQCLQRSNLVDVHAAVGDNVLFKFHNGSFNQGVVLSVYERRNILQRPSATSNSNKLQLKSIAANIDQLFLIVSSIPLVPLSTIDNYIIAAHASNIPNVSIIVNKMDLLGSSLNELLENMNCYEKLGYNTFKTSIIDSNYGIESLKQALVNKTSMFVGQSGVGKSSLLNSIIPSLNIKTGELIKNVNIGAHTTSNARLYKLADGGNIIDSPGIRELGIWHLSRDDIKLGFIEIYPFISKCKFRNCKHSHAEGNTCAVRNAVENGQINPRRYESFMKLISV